VAHPVDRFIDRAFFLDIEIAPRNIGLWLVIVIVGDEVLDRIIREEGFEFSIELRRQSFIRREDQSRSLGRFDDLGHGKGLAGSGRAEQDLVALALLDTIHEFGNRGALITGRIVRRIDFERDPTFQLFPTAVGTMRRPLAARQAANRVARCAGLIERANHFAIPSAVNQSSV